MKPVLPFKRLSVRHQQLPEKCDIYPESLEILYEDEALIAVNKPACLPMHANLDPQRGHLIGILEGQLIKRDGTSGYIGVHQRLDWGTSGVVIFTRCKAANASIAQQFAAHSLTKVYLALAHGRLWPGKGVKKVAVPLGSPQRRGGRIQLNSPGALAAVTLFKVLQRCRSAALIEAQLETGRKHQVRAHLFSLGVHLYGDQLYGGQMLTLAQRPMLHSSRITLRHPFTEKELTIIAPAPNDMQRLAQHLGLTDIDKTV